eukprot:371934-Prorocentrum_lima.AAC.1
MDEGPWDEPLQAFGARLHQKPCSSQDPIKDSPYYMQAIQVSDAVDGEKSKGKPGFLSTKA